MVVSNSALSLIIASVALCFGGAFARGDPRTGESILKFFAPPDEFKSDYGGYRSVLTPPGAPPICSASDWKGRRKALLKEWHDVLGPWPPLIKLPRIEYLQKEHAENFTRHRVNIEIAPGRTTEAYLLIPDGKGRFPAVLDVFYQPLDGAGLNAERRLQNDFGYQLARRGFVALCVGQQPWLKGPIYYPGFENAQLQPLSYLAYVAANCANLLSSLPQVDRDRIGIVGHSYGGKWAMFAGALHDRFACVVVSDPGIVFDESRPNVNYWEPWYLGYEAGREPRKAGVPTESNPRTGPYKRLFETGRDLHELFVLIAPRPFFVAGGSEDPPSRWRALNHAAAVNKLLGYERRVGMSNRPDHKINPEANEQICQVFEHFLKPGRR